MENTVTIPEGPDSTIDFQSTDYLIYIQPTVPTIWVTVPGGLGSPSGNPFVLNTTRTRAVKPLVIPSPVYRCPVPV